MDITVVVINPEVHFIRVLRLVTTTDFNDGIIPIERVVFAIAVLIPEAG